MDCEKIKERNKEILRKIIKKYKLKESLENLLSSYTSVYVHKDFKQQRIRFLGLKRVTDKRGRKVKKTVQLYMLSKKMIQTEPSNKIKEISKALAEFSLYFEQLKYIKKIENVEWDFEERKIKNLLSFEEYEQMLK